VWSWRTHAGAKFARSSKGFALMTVANKQRFTEEITK